MLYVKEEEIFGKGNLSINKAMGYPLFQNGTSPTRANIDYSSDHT